jgi:haloalkane dehalogenase
VNLFTSPDPTFPALTLDTFKILLPDEDQRARPPSAGSPGDRPGESSGGGGDAASILASCHPTGDRRDSRFVEVHGSRMHYLDVGVGQPVVLLHGNPTWAYLWRDVLPPIARGARCIVPDLIGMGASDKPDIEYGYADQARYLEGFFDALDRQGGLQGPLTLVLHDWGVIVGLDWARRHEERVRGLVLMEAMVRPYESWDDFPEPLRETFQGFRTPTVGYDLIVSQNVFVEQLLPASMLRELSPAEMECYRAPFRDPLHRRVIWRFANDLPIAGEPADSARRVEEYSAWLRRTPIPKLLLTAEPGAITTAADVAWMESHFENLETVPLGPGIHFHQEDHPEEIGRAVATWHERVAGS